LPEANTLSFTDDEDRTITLNGPCVRIVTLYSAHTENLFAIEAGNAVIGVPNGTDYPFEAAALPHFDYHGDPEYVIAAEPDLVLIRPFVRRQSPDYVAELEKAGLPVVSLYPESLDDFDAYITRLGILTGKTDEAGEKLAAFHRRLGEIQKRTGAVTEKKRVFFEATENEVRTAAAGSLPAKAIEAAGGINVAAESRPLSPGSSIARFGAEKVLGLAEEIDVYVVQQGAMNRSAGLESLRGRPGFSAVKAVREGRVFFISEKLISATTFRYLEGVQLLARYLYPELME
jgi:iron complex transport system substrate-binding protein